MGKGIGVPFVADVSGFIKGTNDVEGALSGVIDSLDSVAREGKNTERDVARALKGMSDDAKQTDKDMEAAFQRFSDAVGTDAKDARGDLEREFRTAFDQVERDAKTAGTKTGHALSKGIDDDLHAGKASRSQIGGEIGGELVQNIGEGIGSGQSDLVGVVLGTLGGILPALGPIAAAIGIGTLVVQNIFSGMTEATKKREQQARDLGAGIFQAYSDGIVSEQEKQDTAAKALGVDTWLDASQKIHTIATDTGLDYATVYAAVVDHSKPALAKIQAVQDAHTKFVNGGVSGGRAGASRTGPAKVMDDVALAAQGVKTAYDQIADAQRLANQLASDQWQIEWNTNTLLRERINKLDTIYNKVDAINKIKANPGRYLSS